MHRSEDVQGRTNIVVAGHKGAKTCRGGCTNIAVAGRKGAMLWYSQVCSQGCNSGYSTLTERVTCTE